MWLSSFLLKALVRRVKRRMDIRIVRVRGIGPGTAVCGPREPVRGRATVAESALTVVHARYGRNTQSGLTLFCIALASQVVPQSTTEPPCRSFAPPESDKWP